MTIHLTEQEFERMCLAAMEQDRYQHLYMTIAQLIEPPRPFSRPFKSHEAIYKATRVDRGVGDYYDVWIIAHWSQFFFPDTKAQKQELEGLLWNGPNVAALLETAVNECVISEYVEQAQHFAGQKLRPQQVSERLTDFRPWLKRAVLANSRVQGQWLTRQTVTGQWGAS